MNLQGRDFLTLKDFTPEEISYLLDLSAELKDKKKKGIPVDVLRGKNVALIFEKTSTRTRCAFEVAAHDLGMGTTYLDPTGSQIGKKESIRDTARVLAGMYEGIEYRGFGQEIVEELAKYSKVPVWNGPDQRVSSDPDAGGYADHPEQLGHLKGREAGIHGDARYNMGKFSDDCLRKDGHGLCGMRAGEIFPQRGTGSSVPRVCKGKRSDDHPH